MSNERYDVIIIGGGIAGSGLATVLARGGKSVLLLERTTQFRDVVRGEWIAPWGVVEARRTGLYEILAGVSQHHLPYHVEYGEGIDPAEAEAQKLDLRVFLPGVPGPLAIGHPNACQALFDAAVSAGASAVRRVTRFAVQAGPAPSVAWETEAGTFAATARLVVGADGRNSQVRKQLGVTLHEDPPHHLFAGLLVEDVPDWPEEVESMGTEGSVQYFVFPQGGGRHRLYLSYGYEQKGRFSGEGAAERFLEACRLPSVPGSEAIAAGRIAGPCHSVPNQSTWVDSPVREGAVLIGDAAGFNDPIVGQGLSISLRDVRIVGELLLGSDDWRPELFTPYAEERAERMRRLRFAARLDAVIHAEFGPEATARKLRFREARAKNPLLGLAAAAVMVGPELVPAEAFTDEAWAELMAV